MPDIPNFLNETTDFQRRVPPVYDAAEMAMPGRILARGGEEFSAEMNQFAQRYNEARRQSDAANTVFNASNAIADIQQKYSLMPDRQAAMTGFTKDFTALRNQTLSTIQDPFVKSFVTRRLDEEGIARGNEVERASFGLEASTRRGELDQRMAGYADQAAAAADPVNRQRIIDEAIGDVKGTAAAGWIKPEEAALHELNFKSMVQEVSVRRAFNDAINSQSPLAMHRIESALSDPSQFPGLRPERREVLQGMVANQAARLESRAIAAQAHADVVAEREQRREQAVNEAVLLTTDKANLPDDATMQTMARNGQISAAAVEAVQRRKDQLTEGKTNNPKVFLELLKRHGEGQDVSDEGIKRFVAGDISERDAAVLMHPVPQVPAVKQALDQMKGVLGNTDTDAFEKAFSTEEKATKRLAWASAQREFYNRVAAGEEPQSVANNLIAAYGPPAGPPPLETPKFGAINSAADIGTVWQATKSARQAGRIGDAEMNRQADLLSHYYYYFEATNQNKGGAKGPAPGARPKPGTPEWEALPQSAKDYYSGKRDSQGETPQ
jgi:hypothetical protein